MKTYKGKYTPTNPRKYRGNPSNIIYRSSWERKFMVYCDTNEKIIEWCSEEVIIPYLSPWDGKMHRYFPDFYIKIKQHNGTTKKLIIEVKPKKHFVNVEGSEIEVTLQQKLEMMKHGYDRYRLENGKPVLKPIPKLKSKGDLSRQGFSCQGNNDNMVL